MKPDDMLTFLAVAEAGSFTKAADVLATPKSNISRKITRLETELNTRLLERTTRSINLTEAGRLYLQHCQRIQEEIEGARLSLEKLTTKPSGTIRICTTVTVGQNLLAPLFIEFQKQYPDVKLDIHLTNRRVDLIEEGFDLAFRVGELEDSTLISKRICSLSLSLFASPDYLKHKTAPNSPEELSNHQCLFMSGQDSQTSWPLKINNENISVSPSMMCNDFGLLYQACLKSSGIAMLPDYMCEAAIEQKSLKRVLSNEVGRNVDIYALMPSKKGRLPKLTALLEFTEVQLKRTPV